MIRCHKCGDGIYPDDVRFKSTEEAIESRAAKPLCPYCATETKNTYKPRFPKESRLIKKQ